VAEFVGVGALERTFAWLSTSRRLAIDYDKLPETGETFINRGDYKFGRKRRSHLLIEVVGGKDVQRIIRGGAGAN
jgi:hypothetical protein